MLPVDRPPHAGEAFPVYLLRLAESLETAPATLYSYLGLRRNGHTIPYLHLILPPVLLAHLNAEADPKNLKIRATLLVEFAGLDLTMLLDQSRRASHRDAQRAQWLMMSGTRLCPECLRAGQPWLNFWQLPWAYACLAHHATLIDRCPRCGCRPDLAVRTGRKVAQTTALSCCCGQPWADLDVGAPTTPVAEQTAGVVMSAVAGDLADLWGAPASGFDRLAAWRAVGALAAGTPGMETWARRPFLVPPRDAHVMEKAVTRAAPVMTAGSIDEASVELGNLMRAHSGWGEAVLWDRVPRTSPIAPIAQAWLRRTGRVHVRLSRTQQNAFNLAGIDAATIPTLAPTASLPARWQTSPVPDVAMRRATLSLAVARLAGAGTWSDAGGMLGIDDRYAAKLVGHALRQLGTGSADELTASAFRLATTLCHRPQPARRPSGGRLDSAAALRRFARLELPDTHASQAGARQPYGERRPVRAKADGPDGDLAAERVTFAIDGKAYEIDLTREQAAKFRAAIERFVAAGRRVGGAQRRDTARSRS